AAALGRERAHGGNGVFDLGDLHDVVRAHALGGADLLVVLHDRHHVAAGKPGDLDKHQSDRSGADHRDGVADLGVRFFQAADDAGQRLDDGRFLHGHLRRNHQHVLLDDAARNLDELGVGAVVEQQVFAEVFLVARAVEAHAARSRVERDHALAAAEVSDPMAGFRNHAGQLVPEQRGRNDHARVVAALVDLQVGAAGEGNFDFDQDLAVFDARNGDALNLYVLFTVEDGCGHLLAV